MNKHVAVYVRVSNKSQDQRSQLPDLEKWAAVQDDMPIVWYRDTATGRTMDRPAWNKLVAAMEAGKISKLVMWRLDRLGRTAKALTALFEELQVRKVSLFSLRDSLDLSTVAGRLMANVQASYETEIRAERVQAGHAVARKNGKRWGGSKKGRLLSVIIEQRNQVLAMRGQKIARIARTVGLPRLTINRLLEQRELVLSRE